MAADQEMSAVKGHPVPHFLQPFNDIIELFYVLIIDGGGYLWAVFGISVVNLLECQHEEGFFQTSK